MLSAFTFYLFSTLLLASSLFVVTTRQPVFAVLALIVAFFNAAGLFVLVGAEYLAMLLVIVYVGAIAVLFLFVVMMLDVQTLRNKAEWRKFLPMALGVGALFVAQLLLLLQNWQASPQAAFARAFPAPELADADNARSLGQLLYTHYALPFQVCGLILLVAMIGAIVLTHRTRAGVKRQNAWAQMQRNPADDLSLAQPAIGAGVVLEDSKDV